ncbi:hypothetical protein VNO80_26630 [Phaseolus coccineus]|uniref:Uncharacterized protein n=1 Tax=Phaseolus coccineus TaxID=3886 RepID=A0AAN9QGW4_PHACN
MGWRNNTFLSLILRFEIGFVEETNEKFLREKRWKENLIMQIPTDQVQEIPGEAIFHVHPPPVRRAARTGDIERES